MLIDLTDVINSAKFGFDRIQGFGLVSNQILGFCLYLSSRPNTTLLENAVIITGYFRKFRTEVPVI
jgi:hypothetical protein